MSRSVKKALFTILYLRIVFQLVQKDSSTVQKVPNASPFAKKEHLITLRLKSVNLFAKKERLICDAAAAYMDKNNYEWEFRFDIISIVSFKKLAFYSYSRLYFITIFK